MNIKQTRHSLNMSVREFADALGVSPNAVRRWEMNPIRSGYRTPSRQTMMLIEILMDEARHLADRIERGEHLRDIAL